MRLKIFHIINRLITDSFKPNKTDLNYVNISQLREMTPHLLQGYLSDDERPNSLVLLPPPPDYNSVEFMLDLEHAKKAAEFKDHHRFVKANSDADLAFPMAAKCFEETLGIEISEEKTPKLYVLMRRVMTDAGLSTYDAKNHYKRERPFVINKTKTCIPDQEEALSKAGSFPSGHAAIGWAWALIFSEIFPNKKDTIIERGYEFGQSRIICHVHWNSDVEMGRKMGKATVEKLYANTSFQKDFNAAKKEILKSLHLK